MKKIAVSMLVLTIIALALPAPARGQQQEQQQPGQQQQQQKDGWGEITGRKTASKPMPKPAPKPSSSKKVVVVRGGQQQQQQQSVTVVGADSARVSAIEAELRVLKARPDPGPAILERIKVLGDELTLIEGRVAALEATSRAHGNQLGDHEDRIAREENRGHGTSKKEKAFLYVGAGGGGFFLIACAAGFKGLCRNRIAQRILIPTTGGVR